MLKLDLFAVYSFTPRRISSFTPTIVIEEDLWLPLIIGFVVILIILVIAFCFVANLYRDRKNSETNNATNETEFPKNNSSVSSGPGINIHDINNTYKDKAISEIPKHRGMVRASTIR